MVRKGGGERGLNVPKQINFKGEENMGRILWCYFFSVEPGLRICSKGYK